MSPRIPSRTSTLATLVRIAAHSKRTDHPRLYEDNIQALRTLQRGLQIGFRSASRFKRIDVRLGGLLLDGLRMDLRSLREGHMEEAGSPLDIAIGAVQRQLEQLETLLLADAWESPPPPTVLQTPHSRIVSGLLEGAQTWPRPVEDRAGFNEMLSWALWAREGLELLRRHAAVLSSDELAVLVPGVETRVANSDVIFQNRLDPEHPSVAALKKGLESLLEALKRVGKEQIH